LYTGKDKIRREETRQHVRQTTARQDRPVGEIEKAKPKPSQTGRRVRVKKGRGRRYDGGEHAKREKETADERVVHDPPVYPLLDSSKKDKKKKRDPHSN
jgi:hypothetical protein